MAKILTFEQLVQYFESQNITTFSAKESGDVIKVVAPARFELTDSDEFMLFAKIYAWHIGRNANGSNATEKASKKAMKKLAYKPVLANFTDVNGERDFTSHDIEINNDGTYTYIERQVGCFTADAPYFEHNDDNDKDYVCAKIAIPREYTDAADIIERKGGTDVSVEFCVSEMAYDAKNKEIMLNEFEATGITLLGVNPETGDKVNPGMSGAHVDLEASEVEMFSRSEIRKLKKLLESYNLKEGGKTEVTKFEELLAKYNKTAEDIDFDYSEMSDEELEAKFAELFEEQNSPSVDVTEAQDDEAQDEPATDEPTEDEAIVETNAAQPTEGETAETVTDTFSITHGDKVQTFALTLQEKLNALYELVNATYSEVDGDWYSVDADEENKTVIFHGWYGSYRQSYAVRKGEYSLVGDRVAVHAIYVTDDEEKILNEKLGKFEENATALEAAQKTLANYEAEPAKMAKLNEECYAPVAETEEFVALKEQSAHFELSLEEVAAQADAILLNAAKQGKVEFAAKATATLNMFGAPENKSNQPRGRYGGIFRNHEK